MNSYYIMDLIIILILCIVIILYIISDFTKNGEINFLLTNAEKQKKKPKKKFTNYVFSETEQEKIKNIYLIDTQYHQDYFDVITAINNLTTQKEHFNRGGLVENKVEPNRKEILNLVNLFIGQINLSIANEVNNVRTKNDGWDDQAIIQSYESGWEEFMKELGLPKSLYSDSLRKGIIELIKITKIEQFNTRDQIRFVCEVIIQKLKADDQMVLKLHFLKTKSDDPKSYMLEQVFILGYLTNDLNQKSLMDNFHQYNDIKGHNGIIDQEKLITKMMEKHQDRSKVFNKF